jgi:hypothetical protein
MYQQMTAGGVKHGNRDERRTRAGEGMKVQSWIKQIERRQKAIGAERDKLRAMISELEELESTCSDAYDNLQYAIDRLSELT